MISNTVDVQRHDASGKRALLMTASAAALTVAGAFTGLDQAFAQAQPQTQTAQAPAVEEVVITGSAIVRNGYQAPTPVTVMNAEEIARDAPANIADFVNKMPEFSSSPTGHSSATSVSDGNGGASNLNLRSLGPNRTLVLLDGMRIVPSSVSGFYNNGGSVDTNSFPDALISRVDVVTGGASAVYGDDALSGVVNFILDKTFTGVKGTIEGGVSTYGDDREYLLSLTAGTGFAGDRGHVVISAQNTHNDGILHGSARAWIRDGWGQMNNPNYTPTNGQPFYLVGPQIGNSLYTPGGLITGGPLKGYDFGPGGVPHKFSYGSLNDGYAMQGGDWQETVGIMGAGFGTDASLDNRITRSNLFGRASFDVTDDVQVFAQVMYAITDSIGYCCATTGDTTINASNPFIPASVRAQMTASGVTSFPLSISMSDAIGVSGPKNTRQLEQYVLGGNGKFDAFDTRWSWDIYGSRSISRLSARAIQNLIGANFAKATDVVTNPATGLPICSSTLTDPTNGCVPFNPMGVGVNSQAAINYLSAQGGLLDQKLKEDDIGFTVKGEPFSTWAGPVSLALGYVHRKQDVSGAADPISQSTGWWVGNFKATFGGYDVNEGYAETVIPLAKDVAWAKSLDLNAAIRETDYSTSGQVTTWKIGLTYSPTSDLRFRATRSRDIRAPNLGDLFQAGQAGTGTVRDPFKGNATVPDIQLRIGNSALAPEDADTTGAGVVYQPAWFPGFSASFDYYNIDISGAIAALTVQQEVDRCFAGDQYFCSFINRNVAGNITTILLKPANAGAASTHGFDVEASYTQKLADFVDSWQGSLSARFLATHVMGITTTASTGEVLSGLGVLGGSTDFPVAPHWRYNMTVTYDTDAFTLGWTGRGLSSGIQNTQWIQCTSGCPTSVAPDYTINDNHMPGMFAMDLNFTYHLNTESAQSDLFFVVENLTNWEPRGFAMIGFLPGNYDVMGRIFRAGVRFKM